MTSEPAPKNNSLFLKEVALQVGIEVTYQIRTTANKRRSFLLGLSPLAILYCSLGFAFFARARVTAWLAPRSAGPEDPPCRFRWLTPLRQPPLTRPAGHTVCSLKSHAVEPAQRPVLQAVTARAQPCDIPLHSLLILIQSLSQHEKTIAQVFYREAHRWCQFFLDRLQAQARSVVSFEGLVLIRAQIDPFGAVVT